MVTKISEQERQLFCESVGMVLSQFGMARMAGRILGWLMIADPAHQSSADLARGLGASKGSISTNTRMLVQLGFIEKMGIPGQRATYFRLVANPLENILNMEMHGIVGFRDASERALALLDDPGSETYRRLTEHLDVWRFLEREYPKLLERYQRARSERGEE